MNKPGNHYIKFINIALALSFLLFLYLQFLKFSYSPDDTYIYLKYSQNLAAGDNFSFNKGEPSYGVTSPLWTILLAIPFTAGLDGFWFAKFLDLILITLSFILFFRLTGYFIPENYPLRILAVIIFMLNPWVIRSAFTGMETSLAVLIVLLIFYLYYKEKFYLLFFLLGVSVLVRPEFLFLFFVFLVIMIFRYWQNKRDLLKILKYIALTSAVIIPFWIFSYFNFGTIISNTSTGKAVLTKDISILLAQAKEILRVFIMIGPLETLLAFGGIIVLLLKRRFGNYLPVIFWVFGLLALYMVTSAAVMSRYFMIIYPLVLLLSLSFIDRLSLKRKFIIPVLLIIFAVYSQVVFFKYVKPYCDGFTSGIHDCLIPVGKWLNENTPPGSRILVNDVGAIGFSADRYIIDAAALINRDLNLNKKIMSVPNIEKEFPHHMLNFIDADYLIEKDAARIKPLEEAYNYKLEACAFFVFQQMWVFDPKPQYYTIYKISKKTH